MTLDDLRPVDLDLHAQLGIPVELLAAAGVRRVTDEQARELLSSRHTGDLSGVVYPYRDPTTGQVATHRVRRDHPEFEDGKPRDKYLSSYGDPRRLFFSPGADALLADTTVSVVFLEAEKSALATTAAAARTGRQLLAVWA